MKPGDQSLMDKFHAQLEYRSRQSATDSDNQSQNEHNILFRQFFQQTAEWGYYHYKPFFHLPSFFALQR